MPLVGQESTDCISLDFAFSISRRRSFSLLIISEVVVAKPRELDSNGLTYRSFCRNGPSDPHESYSTWGVNHDNVPAISWSNSHEVERLLSKWVVLVILYFVVTVQLH